MVGRHGNRGAMRQRGRCFDGCVATVIKPERSTNEQPKLDVVIRSPKCHVFTSLCCKTKWLQPQSTPNLLQHMGEEARAVEPA